MGLRSSVQWRYYEVEGGRWARARLGIAHRGVTRVKACVTPGCRGFKGGRGRRLRVRVAGWLAWQAIPELDIEAWRWHPFSQDVYVQLVVVQ